MGTLVSFPPFKWWFQFNSPQVISPSSFNIIFKDMTSETVWPFQPSVTVDAAIRIGLHSAEVAHLCHNIWFHPSGIIPNHRNTVRGSSTITFHLQTLVWAPLPMSLASQWRPTVNLGTAQGLGRTFTSFRIISYHFFCGRGSFRHNPDDACLEGTHTKTHKLPVKPYP